MRLSSFLRRMFSGSTEWQSQIAVRAKPLTDGTVAKGVLMHRRIDGRSEYRRPTEAERQEHDRQSQW